MGIKDEKAARLAAMLRKAKKVNQEASAEGQPLDSTVSVPPEVEPEDDPVVSLVGLMTWTLSRFVEPMETLVEALPRLLEMSTSQPSSSTPNASYEADAKWKKDVSELLRQLTTAVDGKQLDDSSKKMQDASTQMDGSARELWKATASANKVADVLKDQTDRSIEAIKQQSLKEVRGSVAKVEAAAVARMTEAEEKSAKRLRYAVETAERYEQRGFWSVLASFGISLMPVAATVLGFVVLIVTGWTCWEWAAVVDVSTVMRIGRITLVAAMTASTFWGGYRMTRWLSETFEGWKAKGKPRSTAHNRR